MTQDEWKAKEKSYQARVTAIVIPPDVTPQQIIAIQAEIDPLYAEARIDLAKTKRTYDRVKRDIKNYEKMVGLNLKQMVSDPAIPKELKPSNEKERDAWCIDYIKRTHLPGYNIDIYIAMNIAEERHVFIEAVVDILKEKADRLITDVACLKMDAELLMNRPGRGAANIIDNNNYPQPPLDRIEIPNIVLPEPRQPY